MVKITWKKVEQLDGLGHGVELHEDPTGPALAFIDGFEWKRAPGTPATVLILKKLPEDVVGKLKDAAKLVIRGDVALNGDVGNGIFALANA